MKITNFQLFIPGWIIAILTFPGVMLHESAHLLMCYLFNIKVYQVKFFSLEYIDKFYSSAPIGWVIHEKPKRFIYDFFISIGPLLINTILAMFLFIMMTKFNDSWFFGWLAFSIAVNSFPSKIDANILWEGAKIKLFAHNYLILLLYPFIILIYVADFLKIVWFDFIYAYGLYSLTNALIV